MTAKTEAQKRAAERALAAKHGEVPINQLRGAAKSMHDSMNEKQLRDFAKKMGTQYTVNNLPPANPERIYIGPRFTTPKGAKQCQSVLPTSSNYERWGQCSWRVKESGFCHYHQSYKKPNWYQKLLALTPWSL